MLFQDPEISTTEKVKCILDSLNENNEDDLEQVLAEYEYTMSSILQEVLEELLISPLFNPDLKYRVLSTMYASRSDMTDEFVERLEKLITAYIPSNATLEFETVKWLFSFGHGMNHLGRLYKYLNNENIQDITKYNQIFEIRNEYPEETKTGVKYLLFNVRIGGRCKVLCSQYLLQHSTSDEKTETDETQQIIDTLFNLATDEKEEYNIRADSADVLHHYTSGETQERALSILQELGGNKTNIYENKQNVHNVDVSEGLKLIRDIEPSVKYNKIAKAIITKVKTPENTEDADDAEANTGVDAGKIASSLGRIVLDTARYGGFNAEEIMEKIWHYIENTEDTEMKNTLHKRLLEELQDMADTCSSGHALRLINVLSGFGVNVLRISFIDQIVSSFTGRLVARIHDLESKEEQEDIYIDMADNGIKFMTFFTKNYPFVVDELYHEYVDGGYVTVEEFDLAITKAMTPYEGKFDVSEIEFNVVRKRD